MTAEAPALLPLRKRLEKCSTPMPDGCRLWDGGLTTDGYGKTKWGKNHTYRAHRLAWIAWKGPIPPGRIVCHSCDTRACINPAHLFIGTQADNIRDMTLKGRLVTPCGQRAPLTVGQAKAIRGDTRSRRVIAAEYGISHQTVGNIQRGTRWA